MKGIASEKEKEAIENWYNQFDTNKPWTETHTEQEIKEQTQELLNKIHQQYDSRRPIKPLFKRRSYRWIAAAMICLCVPIIGLLNQNPMLSSLLSLHPQQELIPPISHQNRLITDDGRTILLDTLHTGQVIQSNNLQIKKNREQELTFSIQPSKNNTVTWNKLSTARGGMYKIVLPDGSIAWLNAASQLEFPSSFKGSYREVLLSGEAYFDIASHPNQPFMVTISPRSTKHQATHIKVLGTKFNVSAYEEDREMRATLIEGKVKIEAPHSALYLAPNQQAFMTREHSEVQLRPHVNASHISAWTTGFFFFDDCSVEDMMTQIGRWYNKTIVYTKGIPNRHYSGKLSRKLPVEEILKRIHLSGTPCALQGQQIIVYNNP